MGKVQHTQINSQGGLLRGTGEKSTL